jgi:outer membrane immunogenic protein
MSYYTKLALFILLLTMPLALHGQATATGLLVDGLPRVELGANYTYIHANAPPGR